jgi:hypothetical protein
LGVAVAVVTVDVVGAAVDVVEVAALVAVALKVVAAVVWGWWR